MNKSKNINKSMSNAIMRAIHLAQSCGGGFSVYTETPDGMEYHNNAMDAINDIVDRFQPVRVLVLDDFYCLRIYLVRSGYWTGRLLDAGAKIWR